MRRIGIAILVAVAMAIGIGFTAWRLSNPQRPASILNVAEENAANPYAAELVCVDQVLADNRLAANQVETRLAACRGISPAQ